MCTMPMVLMTVRDEKYGVSQMFIDVVEKHFDIVWIAEFEKDMQMQKWSNIVGIIIWGPQRISKAWLDALPNLKVIAAIGAGYNHIDVAMAKSYGVKVSNTPHILSSATAEMGMTLMLAAARDFINSVAKYKEPDYTRLEMNAVTHQVSGSTLGIVGMGSIGYIVAKCAQAFDMKILYHNRNKRPESEEQAVGATYYPKLNDMLPLCDFVIVVVCLTEETKHIMGAEQFKKMKNSAIFINISRGATVDQEALVNALKTGEFHSAALDVTTPEPLPRDHDLLKMSNVIISPHAGSQTSTTRRKMIQLAVDNVLAGVRGQKLPTEVPESMS
ncbi:glyoxylate/hydroxypyruvate reductase B-like [Styela clava]